MCEDSVEVACVMLVEDCKPDTDVCETLLGTDTFMLEPALLCILKFRLCGDVVVVEVEAIDDECGEI